MTASTFPDIRQPLGDRHTIEPELGRGGMDAVYLARDLRLDRPVALKVLPSELAGDSALRERFLRETRTAASFSHPNIVPVQVVGTAEYMSPEQASGDVVDGRSDLYSLGVVALLALTGPLPISGDSTQRIVVKQLTETPLPATTLRPDLPKSLGAAIDRCVAKEPSARFATAELLVEAIDNARLAAPEIPDPIRLFAQQAGTLSLVIIFLTMLAWLMFETFSRRIGAAWQQLCADPDTRRRRRRTTIIALAQLPVAVLLIRASLRMRLALGSATASTAGPPGGSSPATLGNLVMATTGVSLLGVSLLLLARSPFRMPVGERFFRLAWLGPPGRAFLRFSSRGVAERVTGTAVSTVPQTSGGRGGTLHHGTGSVPRVAPAAMAQDRVTALEARVAALEGWRDGAQAIA
jgi:eukaryotic-like serine/threonine-protein kinase